MRVPDQISNVTYEKYHRVRRSKRPVIPVSKSFTHMHVSAPTGKNHRRRAAPGTSGGHGWWSMDPGTGDAPPPARGARSATG